MTNTINCPNCDQPNYVENRLCRNCGVALSRSLKEGRTGTSSETTPNFSVDKKGDKGITSDMGIQLNVADDLTARILSCVIRVHQVLGPGFLEKVYRRSLVIELENQHLYTESERKVTIYYEGQEVGIHRLDLVVEKKVILELKTVESLSRAHYAQVRSYLKATNLKTALLINFSCEKVDFRRLRA